jgi:hypothetical protein
MPKLTFTVSHENGARLKEKVLKKGDISCIINDALDQYFEKAEH